MRFLNTATAASTVYFVIYIFFVHCVKSVRIRSYSGPYFPAFELNTERYSVSLRIQSECCKIRTRITPNTDTFHALVVHVFVIEMLNFVQGFDGILIQLID